jgi:capsular polysaccharide transport system permease protein
MTHLPKDAAAVARPKPPRPDLRAVESATRAAGSADSAAPATPQSAPQSAPPPGDGAPTTAVAPAARPKPKPRPKPQPKPAVPATPVPGTAQPAPEVRRAAMRPRHWMMLASFVLLVLAPLGAVAGYLWTRAADQYHSEIAFSIRSDEIGSAAAGLIGALTQINTGSASDGDILYEYIRSQKIVEQVDADLDLRAIFNRAEGDPVFTLGDAPSIEALHAQWHRMVDVAYEGSAGIIHVQVRAFTPEDAHAISAAILAESDALVNTLSEQARADAIRFARDELDEAEANLREMREKLSDFRRHYNLVDPAADVAGQMGLLTALQAELAQALVDRDVLTSYAAEGDQRVVQADRRITAITDRIEDERTTLDVTGVSASLPEVVGAYEELLVDLEFANTAYTQTLAGLAAARAEARRQSRYLASHVRPTLAESPLYPRRLLLTGLAGLFLLLGWGILMLVYYNVRDNR